MSAMVECVGVGVDVGVGVPAGVGQSLNEIHRLLHSPSHPLYPLLSRSLHIIQQALRLYLPPLPSPGSTSSPPNNPDPNPSSNIDKLGVSFNGGKDATIVLFLLFYIISTYPEADQQILRKRLLFIYFVDTKAFPAMIEYMSDIQQQFHIEYINYDCGYKDGMSDAVYTRNMRAILMGVRTGDPYTEHAEHFTPSSPDWPPFMRIYPLFHWKYTEGKIDIYLYFGHDCLLHSLAIIERMSNTVLSII